MKFRTLDSFTFVRPDDEYYFGDYNEKLARFHYADMSNLASVTLARQESLTSFYEKLEKYCQLKQYLIENEGIGLLFTKQDACIYRTLKSEFGPRVKLKDKAYRLSRWFTAYIKWTYKLTSDMLVALIVKTFTRVATKKYDVIFRSWCVPRSIRSGSIRDEYFEALQDDLNDAYKYKVFFNLPYNNRVKYLIAFFRSEKRVCPQHSVIGFAGILRAYVKVIFCTVDIPGGFVYRGYDCKRLLLEAIKEEYYSLYSLSFYLECEFAKAIFDKVSFDRLIYPFENQAWEKVYPLVKKNLDSNACLIGYQHTGLSNKFLNYFPSKVDSNAAYFPDKILTVGDVFTDLLKSNANYPVPIITSSAIRFYSHNLKSAFGSIDSKDGARKSICYAFSVHENKYSKILNCLLSVFSGYNVDVYLKFHPLFSESSVIKKMGITFPDNFHFVSDQSLQEILSKVCCVLYDDNSVGIEALVYGVKSYMLQLGEPIYNCNRLYYYGKNDLVIDAKSLFRFRDALVAGKLDLSLDEVETKQYIQKYYSPYIHGESFYEFLNV